MLTQTSIFLFGCLLGIIIILVLATTSAFFIWQSRQTSKKIDELLEKGKIKSFKDIFLSQKGRSEELEEKIKGAISRIENLESLCEISIQKIGIVRFNPFSDMGGNQSFVIALLDNKNNGVLICSLFVKDGNRVYAKSVKEGKSDHQLSSEEKGAIERAIGKK